MRTGYALRLLLLALALAQDRAGVDAQTQYVLKDKFVGRDFLDAWTWETMDDPTHGRVNYVDQRTALQKNLSYATDAKFVMRADSWTRVGGGPRGRDSVRITSRGAYGDSLVVLDVAHMPAGCATWPAFWTLSQRGPWPHGGEIDIIEGVNEATANLVSLHTAPDCTMPQQRAQTGTVISTDCSGLANSNQGCGTQMTQAESYGAPFNAAGGGWYAMQRARGRGVRVWFWGRNDQGVPVEVRAGAGLVESVEGWGMPGADGAEGTCGFDEHFDDHVAVFDLTFCGDWAGSAWSSSGCGQGTCEDFVNNNPAAFAESYWEINSLRVYTPGQ
ncbi:glycoside hydrolase family 16 protein [Heterobasidion irregulare TC 32-1]|uniref:Glycoside hydrolase family 16 protein n=1 Tax=Heterobasidion irregulare (strain TC 32-1) TaxID=747525 RepID=W4K617_HETIT|nr:glycoside hydrolase family 16 protein [Heterobasidion irregulare TC 32-1]ETW80501.1 glycoside hydrolase family 16 protein [Heterobasidion irregulare TC 32-1]